MNALLKMPLLTHALLAYAYTMIIGSVLVLLKQPHPGIWGAVLASLFFYGREAGQREHDLKHATPPWSGVMAWLGAEFLFGWAWSNVQDWLAAVGGTFVALALLVYLFGW